MVGLSLLASTAVAKGADTILEKDPHGVTVTVISVAVVIVALIGLALFISLFSKLMERGANISFRKPKAGGAKGETVVASTDENAEIIAAISLALKLHEEDLHDRESEVITLNAVARAYSPWSSKIHGLTQMPR
ncbi:MAG: OadG family protein [Rikenellaceae bacterium]